MTVDRERIAQYLQTIERLLQDWRDASNKTTLTMLQKDRKTCLYLCYVMEGAIQTSLDLANHIIGNFGLRKPSSYRESFAILGEEKWVTKRVSGELEELAAFRNILVHRYPDLDMKKVLPHVKKSWKTIQHFTRALSAKLKRK